GAPVKHSVPSRNRERRAGGCAAQVAQARYTHMFDAGEEAPSTRLPSQVWPSQLACHSRQVSIANGGLLPPAPLFRVVTASEMTALLRCRPKQSRQTAGQITPNPGDDLALPKDQATIPESPARGPRPG